MFQVPFCIYSNPVNVTFLNPFVSKYHQIKGFCILDFSSIKVRDINTVLSACEFRFTGDFSRLLTTTSMAFFTS